MTDFFDLIELEKFNDNHPDSVIFAFLAAQYLNIGQIEKALEVSEKGIHKHPSYGFGHYILGLCHVESNDLAKGKTHLELSVAYDDKNPAAFKLLGEINEKLELPLMAQSSFLQYYLLDSFEKDAVEKFHQSEMDTFNDFENIPLDDSSGSSEASAAAGIQEDEDDTFSIDDFFEDEEESGEALDLTEKMDEVFKESLGDINIETSLEDRESDADDNPDDAFENLEMIDTDKDTGDTFAADDTDGDEPLKIVDELTEDSESHDITEGENFEKALDAAFDSLTGEHSKEDITKMSTPEPTEAVTFESGLTSNETEESTSETSGDDDADVDIVAELDEFFAEYDSEEDDLDDSATSEDEVLEFGNILFDEPAGTDATAPLAESESDELDLDSLVDDIITERKDEARELADEAETLFDGATDESDVNQDVETDPFSDKEPDVSAGQSRDDTASSRPRSPGNANKSGFSSPPILSPTLGEIYVSQGRFEEAIDVFRQLLEKDPDNSRFQKKIKDIQAMLDKHGA